MGKVHCGAGSQICLLRTIRGQEDLRRENAHVVYSLICKSLLELIGVSMGRRLYRLVETRSYRYNYTDPTVWEGPNPCRSPRKIRGQTAHGSTTHPLTVGFIAELFPPQLRSLGAAEIIIDDRRTREKPFQGLLELAPDLLPSRMIITI